LENVGCDLDSAQWITKLGGIYAVLTQLWQSNVQENINSLGRQVENLNLERARAIQKYGPNSSKVRAFDAELIRVRAQEKEMKEEYANLVKAFK
jgi:hypothetical protein